MAISQSSGILSITIDTHKVTNLLNNYQRKLPRLAQKIPKRIASMYANFYLQALHRAKVTPFTGTSFMNLMKQEANPIRLGKSEYGVVVNQYLVALDRMRPHFVSLRRRPMLQRWAKLRLGFVPRKMIVRPHPWIRSAHIAAGKNVKKIASWELTNFSRER